MAWQGFGNATVNVILFVIAGWLVSLCLHEYAHALLAYRAGDRAVAERGYLTLNPLKYTHPLLSIVLPVVFLLLGGIGLPGGAVWVDRHADPRQAAAHADQRGRPGRQRGVRAAADACRSWSAWTSRPHLEFWAGVAFLAFLQFTAALLNLLPIPGVDGGNMLQPWLSPDVGAAVRPVGAVRHAAALRAALRAAGERHLLRRRVLDLRPDRPAARPVGPGPGAVPVLALTPPPIPVIMTMRPDRADHDLQS